MIKISLKFISKGPFAIGLDNGLAPNSRQAIISNNADLIHWRIYAALRGYVLTVSQLIVPMAAYAPIIYKSSTPLGTFYYLKNYPQDDKAAYQAIPPYTG